MRGAWGLLFLRVGHPGPGAGQSVRGRVRVFRLGVSWGGYESLVFLPIIGAMHKAPEANWPSPGLVRIHVGLEDVADLIADLDQALRAL